jgi:hypothetical protein
MLDRQIRTTLQVELTTNVGGGQTIGVFAVQSIELLTAELLG